MKQMEIRCPKGPARIYLFGAIGYVFVLMNDVFINNIFQYPEQKPVMTVIKSVLIIAANTFMCRVLYAKRYDNLLIAAVAATTAIPIIAALLIDATPLIIGDFILYLLLTAFTYVAIKMPDTAIREKCVRLRFIIPLACVIQLAVSTIFSINALYERQLQSTGAAPGGNMNAAIVVLPITLTALSGALPVLNYVLFTNWLSDPYEKKVNKNKKKDGR